MQFLACLVINVIQYGTRSIFIKVHRVRAKNDFVGVVYHRYHDRHIFHRDEVRKREIAAVPKASSDQIPP